MNKKLLTFNVTGIRTKIIKLPNTNNLIRINYYRRSKHKLRSVNRLHLNKLDNFIN